MYFDFEDYRPDISPVGRAMSWREGVLISIIVHLLGVIAMLLAPKYLPESLVRPESRTVASRSPTEESPRFVFVQPRQDERAPKPPDRGDASDQDRMARTVERPKDPKNTLPFSRGNTFERVERMEQAPGADQGRAREAAPTPPGDTPAGASAGEPDRDAADRLALPESPSPRGLRLPAAQPPGAGFGGGRTLGDALRNLQRYVQADQFENPQGGGGSFGPAIQFDTKGVEFGPWIRRFIAQVKRNWLIPYAAMSAKGHVVVTFNVHKDGAISDLTIAGPSPIDAFNNAAVGALSSSNPTTPLPPEYPADKAFFTVTFFYNEPPQ